MLTLESLLYLRDKTYLDVKENRDTMEKLMTIYSTSEWLEESPTYQECEKRKELLADTLCRLEEMIEQQTPKQ